MGNCIPTVLQLQEMLHIAAGACQIALPPLQDKILLAKDIELCIGLEIINADLHVFCLAMLTLLGLLTSHYLLHRSKLSGPLRRSR